MLPPGEDESEWLATSTVDFFNTASLVYGTVADHCTPESCPTMSAGPRYEYLWADASAPKPMRCAAPDYVDRLLTWVDAQLHDEALFPVSPGTPFPKDFKMKVVAPIIKRLARVFSHLFYHHFDQILAMGAERHLNTGGWRASARAWRAAEGGGSNTRSGLPSRTTYHPTPTHPPCSVQALHVLFPSLWADRGEGARAHG